MSTNQLSVSATTGAPDAAVISEVVASLPVSFRHSLTERSDVAAVDGTDGWAVRALPVVTSGVRAIVVTNPRPQPAASILELASAATAAGVHVILSEGWSGNPAVAALTGEWGEHLASATLIEIISGDTTAEAFSDAVFRQVRMLRALGFGGATLRAGTVSPTSFSLVGSTSDGALVSLFGARSSAAVEHMQIIAGSADVTVRATLSPDRTARPASVELTTVDARSVLPTIWETAHRASWIRVHAAISSGSIVDELTAFAEDVELARSLG
jgi:hypothetical protein